MNEDLNGDPLPPAPARHRAGRGFVRRHPLILSLALVVVVFLVASSVLFVWPATNQPRRVNAIVSLNGENEVARESTAVSLAKEGYAPVLLFSQGGNAADTTCPSVPQVSVVCFVSYPPHTNGEVAYAASYARHHGMHSLLIVAGRAQVTRARLLMQRCFSGQIVMVSAPVGLTGLPYEVVYEWGALAKAVVFDRHC
jgi:hypothetical protein